jgi:hypothetical protein
LAGHGHLPFCRDSVPCCLPRGADDSSEKNQNNPVFTNPIYLLFSINVLFID